MEDTEETVNSELLKSKDPIQFYDEVILYEDELADNGSSIMKARIVIFKVLIIIFIWIESHGDVFLGAGAVCFASGSCIV